jgi:cobalt-precorrin 5A hydrolase/precorrin-3B C17-methyltransferase
MSGVTAIVVFGPTGMAVGRRLVAAIDGGQLHGWRARVPDADFVFDDAAQHLRGLFGQGIAIVGVCAAGILIRALAPVLADKHTEPPVVAIGADGAFVVPLLGGHRGANRLAQRIASHLGGHAALTTAGEGALGFALDDPPAGWRLAGGADQVKAVGAALLADQPVRLVVEAGDASWLTAPRLGTDGDLTVMVTDRRTSDATVVLHPPVLALGVGCERGVAAAELIDLARAALVEAGLAEGAVACVASLALKEDEPAVHELARTLAVPARFFDAATLEEQTPRLANPSDLVFRETGCHGVAEGAALAAAGPGGKLVQPKLRSARATCAIARAATVITPNDVGQARGRLFVVGIGPGAATWRTPEATRAIRLASDLVGYGLYLDLLGDETRGKTRHDGTLGDEEGRVRLALLLAAEGRTVALVCSGDAGIYALATLVFELVDREGNPAWNRLDITVLPGVSAVQAAAARVGAPLGHDFCTISLSDLLTPWETIETRLRAAAAADFVVAFYNPVSQRRTTQLAAAKDILLERRPPTTPVVVARNLGRDGETVTVITLADLDPARIDMLTLVLVGNSESRRVDLGGRPVVYTPRGYAKKLNP